jgi:trehalose-phosphatase
MTAGEAQLLATGFFEKLRSAPQRVLLLDYDGTLSPFVVDRNQAFPYPEVPELVSKISASGTRVVLISGRAAREIILLSGIVPHPEIWGSHGLERLRPDGSYEVEPLRSEDENALLRAAEAIRHDGLEPHLELKPGGVAVHWRGMSDPEIEQLRTRVKSLWADVLRESNLKLLDFDGGLELRTTAANKANAVNAILGESNADAAVAYLGDDLTDEDAFEALKGQGLAVLVRAEPRQTSADLRLKGPEELVRFLHDWSRATGGKG